MKLIVDAQDALGECIAWCARIFAHLPPGCSEPDGATADADALLWNAEWGRAGSCAAGRTEIRFGAKMGDDSAI